MKFVQKIATLMILAAIQLPLTTQAAQEDRELALIAAEQDKEEERLDDINPTLTESISTERTQETDKEIKERKKKLKQARKEKEKANERKLEELKRKDNKKAKNNKETRRSDEPVVVIEPEPTPAKPEPAKPEPVKPEPVKPEPVKPPKVEPVKPPTVEPPKPEIVTINPTPEPPAISKPSVTPQPTETATISDQKAIYANFTEVVRAVHFTPLYMPRKSGYEITAIYAQPGIVEVRYGRRWEPTVSLTVRTHKRTDGEELKDISGVTGVKWRVDTTTGTTIYIAKISETQQVAAWAVGHYTFSAMSENLSFAGFHSLVADELVELSMHYYLDL